NPCIFGKLRRDIATPIGITNTETVTLPEEFVRSLSWEARPTHTVEYGMARDANNNLMESVDAGGCEFDKTSMYSGASNISNMYVNWIRLVRWRLNESQSELPCGKILSITKNN